MWKRVSCVEKKEQGIVVLLDSLEGNAKAEKAVNKFTDNEVYVENGLDLLLEKLDSVFKGEKVDEAYNAYSRFKGIGGVQPKKIDFVHFDICCSPNFLLSKMWSYFVQLAQL